MFSSPQRISKPSSEAKQSEECKVDSETLLKYPFLKAQDHFGSESYIATDENSHSIAKITKLYNPKSSEERNTSRWYVVYNTTVTKKYSSRLNRIIVAAGELIRFSDCKLTKYRLMGKDGQSYPISKEVKNAVAYSSSDSGFIEGMGRGMMLKYFYVEDDAHRGNSYMNDYFNVIDHDRCFSPVTLKMHASKLSSNIEITLKDYDNFPLLTDYNPNNWPWPEIEFYSDAKAISRNEAFLNEKHFTTLKLFATESLQKILLCYHIEDKKDQKDLCELLQKRFENLTKVCKESKSFLSYLQANRTSALKAITYEVDQFFKKNKHYVTLFPTLPKNSLEMLITCTNRFLSEVGVRPLAEKEIVEWKQFAEKIESRVSVDMVRLFYIKQKMNAHAFLIDESALSQEFKSFYSDWFANKDKIHLFLQRIFKQYSPCGVDPLQHFLRYTTTHHKKMIKVVLKNIINSPRMLMDRFTATQLGYIFHYLVTEKQYFLANFLRIKYPTLEMKNLSSFKDGIPALNTLVLEEKTDMDLLHFICSKSKASAANKDGDTAFYLAAVVSKSEVVSYFISLSALINQFNPVQLGQVFLHLVKKNQKQALALIQARPDIDMNLWQETHSGKYIIHLAVEDDKPSMPLIRAICEAKPGPHLYLEDHQGETALSLAIKKNHTEIIIFLIEKAIKKFTAKQLGYAFFQLVVDRPDLALTLLTEKSDLDMNIQFSGKHPFLCLIDTDKPNMRLIKTLCEAKSKIDLSTISFGGIDPLTLAIQKEHYDLVRYFIEQHLIQSFSEVDLRPIFLELAKRNQEICLLFLKERLDTMVGFESMHCIVSHKKPNLELIRVLCEDVLFTPSLSLKDSKGNSTLALAILHGNFEVAAYLIDSPAFKFFTEKDLAKAYSLLKEAKQDSLANALLKKGNPIFIAFSLGDMSLILSLCEGGESPVVLSYDFEKRSALFIAAENENDDACNYLVKTPHFIQQFTQEQIGLAFMQLLINNKVELVLSLCRSRPDFDINIFLTGSNAKLYPMHLAFLNKNLNINLIRFICEESRPVANLALEFKFESKYLSCLELVIKTENDEIAEYLIKTPALIQQLTPPQLGRVFMDLIKEKKYVLANLLMTNRPDLNKYTWPAANTRYRLFHLAALEEKPTPDIIKTLCESKSEEDNPRSDLRLS